MFYDYDYDYFELLEIEFWVCVLEILLMEKGYVDLFVFDELIEIYEIKVGLCNGVWVVVKVWSDYDYLDWLREDVMVVIVEFGFIGCQGEYMVVVENMFQIYNMVVCILCFCYLWMVFGLLFVWYKLVFYWFCVVCDLCGVLVEFGVILLDGKEIWVWDFIVEICYLVILECFDGIKGWSEEVFVDFVICDSMIGIGFVFDLLLWKEFV